MQSQLIWIDWTCEGNDFTTSYATDLDAARRIVDLQADPTVTDVRVLGPVIEPLSADAIDDLVNQFDDEQLYDRTT